MTATIPRGRRLLLAAALLAVSGCIGPQRAATPTETDDVVFYCDGAGGGGPLTNWGNGVEQGLKADGYEGDFRNFRWHTGLGIIADHTTSVDYKRRKARELITLMRQHWRRYPGGSVHLIGLSAGSAIVIFALEQLPAAYQVDQVILLGSSLSADYDLRPALRRVRGEMHVFSSRRDGVLNLLVPLVGSADRERAGRRVAGRHGFIMPTPANDETEALYSKVVQYDWDEDRAAAGDTGLHTGATNPRFVQEFIAPLINRDGPRHLRLPGSPPE